MRKRLFIVAVLLLGLLCIRLGFWQLSRRGERRTENQRVAHLLSLPPIELPGEIIIPEDWEYRTVSVFGKFDSQESVLLRNRAHRDQSGGHLISPLIIAETETSILVDRGWIPHTQFLAEEIAAYELSGGFEITGVLRLSVSEPAFSLLADPTLEPGADPLKEWRVLSVERIQEQIPYTLYPMFLEMTDSNPAPGSYPIPNAVVDLSDGPHLSYAIQWFSFAAIAIIGGIFWWRRKPA